jgi:hypothetical protein
VGLSGSNERQQLILAARRDDVEKGNGNGDKNGLDAMTHTSTTLS